MSALFTDLYELTMADAYLAEGRTGPATFELFFRHLPQARGYALAAGLADVLDFLEGFSFTSGELAYLRGLGRFSERLLAALAELRFRGDVFAIPEGTPVFEHEPLVQVVAPIVEAQLVETYLINQVHLQTVLATKAARVVHAAQGRLVIDFGCRRAHGLDAGLKAARCAYLAGAAGTSLLQAGQRWGIPVFGTMAHSFVQAHDDERAAFEAFARVHPGSTLLVDTYDTLAGVELTIELATREREPIRVDGIRLDSGELAPLAKEARRRLDAAGLPAVHIFASGDLDEYAISALLRAGAPIDGFGVGTRMVVSTDAPTLDFAYKLVEYGGRSRTKLATGKVLYPCRKQVFRTDGGDELARCDESRPGRPLLVPVMRGGRRLAREGLGAARSRARAELSRLPAGLHALEQPQEVWPVHATPALEAELRRLRDELRPTRRTIAARH